jgi:hypothetical protein
MEAGMKARSILSLRIFLGSAVILLGVFSALPMIPPRAVAADAPASRFSAERAMADLQIVAREPHAAGSASQATVRKYITEQVQALGIEPEVETSGSVANILVRLPGTDRSGTVLVTGHYDSHPPAPGAGDDGISTVAMLEAIRVLHAGGPHRNDVLFLFTDGEELGYLGASAFLSAHPESKVEISVVLCFDARPGNAPLVMWETSPGDAWLVRQMTGLRLAMLAGSWTNLAERGEIDTDFSVFAMSGFTGAEFENAEAGILYHTAGDTADAISPHLMQSYGVTMLALARHFGMIDLRSRTKAPDLTYFTLPLVGLVAYPAWVMPVLSSIGLLAVLVFAVIACRQKRFTLGRFLLALGLLLLGVALVVLCAQLAWGAVKQAIRAGPTGFEQSTAWQVGLMAGAAVLMVFLLAFLSRCFGVIPLSAAAVLLYLVVGFLFYYIGGGGNPLTTAWLAWPFVGCSAGMGVLLFARKPVWKAVLLACSAFLMLVLMIPQIWLAAYTREDAWIPALVVCAWISLLAPQVDAGFGRALVEA